MKSPRFLFLSSFFLFAISIQAQTRRTPEITAAELRYHLQIIASDSLEGRRAGSRGAEVAAQYIAREFNDYGLTPKGNNGSYFQEFEFVSGINLGKNNVAAIAVDGKKKDLTIDQDFRPLGFSSSGSFDGELVFAGYGISAPDKNYNDYEGVDVKDKAVVLLRFHPEGDNQHSEFAKYSSLRYKAAKAKELGATAIVFVTGPADADNDKLIKLSYDNSMGNAGILALNVTQRAADELLKSSGVTLKQTQSEINQQKKPGSFVLKNVKLSASVELHEIREKTKNVAGYLEGSEPKLRNEVIVIGAHYDHLGYGGEGSGSLKPDAVAIHHGADDNGSGTVGLLELAQAFAANRKELKRSILFLSFSGEEMGLLGSAHFVKNPTVPLGQTVAMINMDMIGRLNERKLIVYGLGTSAGFEALVQKYNRDSMFVLKLNKDGFGPSDHSSFYGKNIPVFHFFTDLHSDYHRPSDDYEKINYDGMEKVLQYIYNIALDLDRSDQKPVYVQIEASRPTGVGDSRGVRSYTGTIPDFGEQTEGMKISGVREGSPAAKAGLQGGDVIIKFGKIEIKNIYDYTYALGEYKPGDVVEVIVKRGKDTKMFTLTLERRN